MAEIIHNIPGTLPEDKFENYLQTKLDKKALEFVRVLSEELDLIVFSGVIRDFYLNHHGEVRDLDLVVKHNFHHLESIINNFEEVQYNKNSFGGYKIKISNLTIDIWNAEDTWAFKERKMQQDCIFIEENLPKSCFFNFSSIVYDIKRKKFINSKNFQKFLKTKTLDIILEANPYPELCVINTFYYQDKFELKISKNLKNYIKENFNKIPSHRFESIQVKHFNQVIYPFDILKSRVDNLLPINRKKRIKNKKG